MSLFNRVARFRCTRKLAACGRIQPAQFAAAGVLFCESRGLPTSGRLFQMDRRFMPQHCTHGAHLALSVTESLLQLGSVRRLVVIEIDPRKQICVRFGEFDARSLCALLVSRRALPGSTLQNGASAPSLIENTERGNDSNSVRSIFNSLQRIRQCAESWAMSDIVP